MKKKLVIIAIIILIIVFMVVFSKIEFYKDEYLYMMSYSKNFDESEDYYELEQEMCYDESYSYNKKRNISISKWEYNNFLFFRWFKVSYIKGNICLKEFVLEESYITNFINNAKIKSNEDNINLAKLIEGKEAIVANTKYSFDENYSCIGYVLDGEFEEMFISIENNGLIIIRVGVTDEAPKYIAYK